LGKAKKAAKEVEGLDMDWSGFGEWLDRLDRSGIGMNLAPLVGHSTIRAAVMGQDYRRHATPAEVEAMKRYVEEAMDSGAQGISNGMDYAPNSYCSPEESVEVIGVAAKRGGLFASHWRRTGLREGFGNPGLIQGLKEAIEIAKKTGAKFEVAHLGPGFQVLPSPTPRLAACVAEETLAVIDDAIKGGVDLTFDVIPNTQTGGVGYSKYLVSPLTPWLKMSGSMDRFGSDLKAPDLRREIRQYIMSGKWYSLNPIVQPGWAGGIKITKSKVPGLDGKTLAEVAKERGQDALDTMMDILSEDPWTTTGLRKGDEATKIAFYKHPKAMVAIDTFVVDETCEGKEPPYSLPNPNSFSGMARYLSLYATADVLGLEDGVRRITGMPAERLGLADRGLIAQGKKADIVVWRPEAVKDTTTEDEPRRYPEGFSWVFVNGAAAMEDGKLRLTKTGRALRRQ
jgi:N-acyl-D-aspartate/D-glutamate deacylase